MSDDSEIREVLQVQVTMISARRSDIDPDLLLMVRNAIMDCVQKAKDTGYDDVVIREISLTNVSKR